MTARLTALITASRVLSRPAQITLHALLSHLLHQVRQRPDKPETAAQRDLRMEVAGWVSHVLSTEFPAATSPQGTDQ